MLSLSEIAEKYKISMIYLFGSQAEAGKRYIDGEEVSVEPYSDLDIAVYFEEIPPATILTYGELYRDFAILFEPFEIDLVFMHEQDSLFQYEIIKGIRIYAKNEEFADEYEELIMKKAADLAFKQKEFIKDILEAIENGYFQFEYKADS